MSKIKVNTEIMAMCWYFPHPHIIIKNHDIKLMSSLACSVVVDVIYKKNVRTNQALEPTHQK